MGAGGCGRRPSFRVMGKRTPEGMRAERIRKQGRHEQNTICIKGGCDQQLRGDARRCPFQAIIHTAALWPRPGMTRAVD